MTATAFAALFAAALFVSLVLNLWLARRHVAYVAAHRDAVPPAFTERIGLAAHQKAADYTIARTRLGAIETIVEMALLLALTFGGGIAALVRLTDVLPFGGMTRDLALIVGVAVVSGLVAIPFS